MYKQIATDIKENCRFCLWRYEKQQDRQTKVPYQISGQRASSRKIQYFISFEEILKALLQYDGIGIDVSSPFVAVDIVTVKNDNTMLYRFKDGREISLPIPDRKQTQNKRTQLAKTAFQVGSEGQIRTNDLPGMNRLLQPTELLRR